MPNPLPIHRRVLSVALLLGAIHTSQGHAGSKPETVSPGARERTTGVRDGCPTFSWAGVADATRYQLVVYALRDPAPRETSAPAMQAEVAASSSFTPALEDCLAAGRYAWVVRAELRSQWSSWSEPRLFEVRDLAQSPEVRRAVEAVVEEWLAQRRIAAPDAAALRDGPVASAPLPAVRSLAMPSVFVPPSCGFDPFLDVPAASPYCGFIRHVVSAGISSGCGGGQYCPQGVVTREQLAVFLTRVLAARGARNLDTGADHTCAVVGSERVACWGRDDFGKATPPDLAFLSVSAGVNHSCGVRTNGTVACWGFTGDGAATPPPGLFPSLSVGSTHSCGVEVGGNALCWGSNADNRATPLPGSYVSVSAGFNHTCGIKTDGTLACWGLNTNGQAPPIPPPGTFLSVSGGLAHSCGVQTDGTPVCWGSDADGRSTPPPGSFASIAAGNDHSCGVKTDGTLACWGADASGQATPPTGTFLSVSAGTLYSCGLRTNGAAACWGSNADGRAIPPGWM